MIALNTKLLNICKTANATEATAGRCLPVGRPRELLLTIHTFTIHTVESHRGLDLRNASPEPLASHSSPHNGAVILHLAHSADHSHPSGLPSFDSLCATALHFQPHTFRHLRRTHSNTMATATESSSSASAAAAASSDQQAIDFSVPHPLQNRWCMWYVAILGPRACALY